LTGFFADRFDRFRLLHCLRLQRTEREKVKLDLSLQTILTAAVVSLVVYVLTEPFKRAIDTALERKIP
jgi:small-conductance mechanosensitive channel